MVNVEDQIKAAIAHFGTQKALAEAMTRAGYKTTQQGVSWWLAGNAPAPEACVVIERLTGIRCETLNGAYEFIRVNDRIYHQRVSAKAA